MSGQYQKHLIIDPLSADTTPQNPCNQTLSWPIRKKYARVTDGDGRIFKGSIDLTTTIVEVSSCTRWGLVKARHSEACSSECQTPSRSSNRDGSLSDGSSPSYHLTPTTVGFTPADAISGVATGISTQTRSPSSGRTIINDHKRMTAARLAGLAHNPVAVITGTDDQAHELFTIAHREQANREQAAHESTDSEQEPSP